MAIFYWTKQPFPHTYAEINDYSKVTLPSTPLDNTCRQLSGIVADMGPDDRTMAITMESAFTELYGKQTYKKHGLMGKACIKNLRAGGWSYVRRLTDEKSKNANASLDVMFETLESPRSKYFILKDATWADKAPEDGSEGTDYVTVELTTAPVVKYGTSSHANLKRKADAELVTPSTEDKTEVVPVYVLMRTGAGNIGNKTQVTFQRISSVSNNQDSVYQMDVIISSSQKERYKVNFVEDSRFDTVPLNIKQVLNNQSYQLNAHSSEANLAKLQELTLDALTKLEADLTATVETLSSNALAQKALQAELDKVTELKVAVEEEDVEATAVTSMFDTNRRFPIVSDLLEDKSTYVKTVKFANGTNGDILKGKFDWNLTVKNDAHETIKIYEELFKKFYEGYTDPTILDFNDTPVDIIYDIGYPVSIKNTIATLTSIPQRRDIIATICPSKVESIAELKSFDEGFKLDNYMCLKEVNWADYYDTDEQKTLNVPITYLMIEAIVAFVNDGWSNPILANRVVSGPISGTVTPVISILTDIEDKTYLVQNGWNYISNGKSGYFLDGQKMASTDPYVVSILQEFHNAFLVGRMLKKITDTLNRNRHFLMREDGVKNVQAVVNKDLEEFRSKAANIQYTAYYEDAFAQAEGLLTHEVNIHMYNSNKSHKLELNVYRHEVESIA